MGHLSKFQSITKNLQAKHCSPFVVHDVVDAMIENDYPETSFYLATNSNIVNNPTFESAIVKLLRRDFLSLTTHMKKRRYQYHPIL